MSIILKGIDMPKSCGECEFNYNLEGGSYEWWECVILHDDINQFDTRRTDCPLIEIPIPHGRLIDGDALREKFEDRCAEECGICEEEIIPDGGCKLIVNAPTILDKERE